MAVKHQFETASRLQALKEHKAETKTASREEKQKDLVMQVIVLECGIVGMAIEEKPVYPEGTELILEREPENPADRWAIRVKSSEGIFLGYLPARKNQSVARLIDAGKKIRAFVASTSDSAYQDALKVFQQTESLLHPLRLYMEIPMRKEEDHES